MCDLQFRRQGLNSSCSVSCQSTTSPPFNPKLLTFGDVSDAWEVPASDLRSRGGPDGEACTQRARSFGCRHLTAGAGTPRRSKVAGQGVWRAPAARTGLGANMATHSSGATKLISLAPPSVHPLPLAVAKQGAEPIMALGAPRSAFRAAPALRLEHYGHCATNDEPGRRTNEPRGGGGRRHARSRKTAGAACGLAGVKRPFS